jgi:hypothetical protein
MGKLVPGPFRVLKQLTGHLRHRCPAMSSHLFSPEGDSLVSPTPSHPVHWVYLYLHAQEEPATGKRKRTVTQAYTEARQAGSPSLGHSQ